MNTIICKHCGKEFELSEALLHQVKETAKQEFDSQHKKDIENIRLETEEKTRIEFEQKNKAVIEKLKTQNEQFREQELKLLEDKRKLEEKKNKWSLRMPESLIKKEKL